MWFHKPWQGKFPSSPIILPAGTLGEKDFLLIAGPCALESQKQVQALIPLWKNLGLKVFRACLYKPRTSPESFQGLREEGLELLQTLKSEGFILEGEVLLPEHIQTMEPYLDIFRVGSRNAQNYPLLQELGRQPKPVIVKRGMGMTVDEWLYSAEHIARGGNTQILLCERGIRSFETRTRYTMDIAGALLAQKLSGLPVLLDPSHGTGIPSLIPPLCLGAVAMGFSGVMVEVHPFPEKALSDGEQALTPEVFGKLVEDLKTELSFHQKTLYGTPLL